MKIDKIVRLGKAQTDGERWMSVYCKIKYDGEKLSISGVEGPLPSGNCLGSCGQITPEVTHLATSWTRPMLKRFLKEWRAWHLNNMRAGCEHQRAEHWDRFRIDRDKPLRSYGRHFEGQTQDSWNMLAWVSPKEHPDGLLGKPCPQCGYKYGTAWLSEKVPDEVLVFLDSLPDTDQTPAWV